MFSIFHGQTRGLGDEPARDVFMKVYVEFRGHLHHFRNARLAVFMAIALHADKEGIAYPDYDLLEKETGYGRDTIGRTIKELCKLEVEEKRVLVKWRERDDKGHFTGSNRYLIFPTKEECQKWENPTLDNAKGGKCLLEVEPSSEVEPSIKKKRIADANNAPAPLSTKPEGEPVKGKRQPRKSIGEQARLNIPPNSEAVKESPPSSVPPPRALAIHLEWVARVYPKKDQHFPNHAQRAAIVETVTDMALWEQTLQAWALAGYRPGMVEGQLEWYRNGGRGQAYPRGKQDRRQVEQSKVSQYDLSKLARLPQAGG